MEQNKVIKRHEKSPLEIDDKNIKIVNQYFIKCQKYA